MLPRAAAVLTIYWMLIYIYRITLHPLAKIPGPKLAGMTFWYELYYDLYPHRCRYLFKIRELHERYGPIVRINPIHVHINDPDYIDEIYTAGNKRRRNRDPWFLHISKAGMMTWSLLHTEDHDLHRIRRAALAPFFSRRAIVALQGLIIDKIERLCCRFSELHQSGEVVDITYAMAALTMDVISAYSLGIDTDCLGKPDWSPNWLDAFRQAGYIRPLARQFKWIINPILMAISPDFIQRFDPATAELSRTITYPLEKIQASERERQAAGGEAAKLSTNTRTVLQNLLESDLPPEEKLPERLSCEVAGLLGAGTEGTARTLAITLFYIYDNPKLLKKLREELRTVMPKPDSHTSIEALENLPYFNAAMTEGLRMSHGASSRMPRIATDEDLVYQKWVIPRGYPVMQSMYLHHTNPKIFPAPLEFKPERWLEDPILKAKYFLAWGRGARNCVGMNLAHAEVYHAVAILISRFEITSYDTDRKRDVEVSRDGFIGMPAADSPGIR
ncbi:hypothetical protein PgNI_05135, partial [Pyricularia grisea]|uniref:Uncharacterized protein n=1 Tax=Pyricularia grisea TaxID=148305 RepID=A0A6P8B3W3_PYRGI